MPFVVAIAVAWGPVVSNLILAYGVLRVVGSALCALAIGGLLLESHPAILNALGLLILVPVGLTIAFGVPFAIVRGTLRSFPALAAFASAQPPYDGWWLFPIRAVTALVIAVTLATLGVGVLFGIIALAAQLGKLIHFH